MIRITCIAMMFFSLPCYGQKSSVRVDVKADRNEVGIADPFQIEIIVKAPTGTNVSFPAQQSMLGPFEVIKESDDWNVPDPDRPLDLKNWTRRFELETLDTGKLEFPSYEVVVTELGQDSRVIRTDPISIDVKSLVEPKSDPAQFQDIADLQDVEVNMSAASTDSVWWIIGGVGSAVIVFGLATVWILFRKPMPIGPGEWALQTLAVTDSEDHRSIEETVRQYLKERFQFSARSSSIDQIRRQVVDQTERDTIATDLEAWLLEIEKIRFGGLATTSPENEHRRERIIDWIQNVEQMEERP
ncbi:MAG: hypothetical protein AAF623_13095 [Planctomycetota bacterium]